MSETAFIAYVISWKGKTLGTLFFEYPAAWVDGVTCSIVHWRFGTNARNTANSADPEFKMKRLVGVQPGKAGG